MIDLNNLDRKLSELERRLDEALSKETRGSLTEFINKKRNKMIKEFVSYEMALALKELGFDEPCIGNYRKVQVSDAKTGDSSESVLLLDMMNFNENNKDTDASALTFSQAFRWFREKYDLFGCIDLHVSTPLHWYVRIDKISINDFVYHSEDDSKYYENYEDAEIACLLKLIELVKNK